VATSIFVNLPVNDLKKSIAFFKALGYSLNEQFSDETAASIVISENIYAMLLTHPKMKEFTQKEIADATKTTEVIVCLSCDSRADVDILADKALAAGGSKFREPMEYPFMYGRSFQDPDGHIWEVLWMDPSFVQKTQ
jgi:hypothetical protein